MLKNTLKENKPRWLILMIDIVLVWGTFIVSYYLLFKHRGVIDWQSLARQLLLVIAIYFLFFLIFQPYRTVIHRTGLRDLQRVAKTVVAAFLTLAGLATVAEWSSLATRSLQWFGVFSHTQLLFHAFMAGFAM